MITSCAELAYLPSVGFMHTLLYILPMLQQSCLLLRFLFIFFIKLFLFLFYFFIFKKIKIKIKKNNLIKM